MSWQQWTILILLVIKLFAGLVKGIDGGENTPEKVGFVLGYWAYYAIVAGILVSGGFFD